MQYVLYILLIAVIFGLVALVDFLLKKLFPKEGAMKSGKAVRMPRYSAILGIIMTGLGFVALLFLPLEGENFLMLGCVLVLVMGGYLVINYARFGIFYDEEQFTYRTLTRRAKTYRYSDIQGQRSFVAKSGLNTMLYAAGDEIRLYSAMQGMGDFLNKAFYRWCDQTGVDPDSVENDPAMLLFFPDPEKTEQEP